MYDEQLASLHYVIISLFRNLGRMRYSLYEQT